MNRYLIFQAFYTESSRRKMMEPVASFDSLEQAQAFIEEQDLPELFEIEDQYGDLVGSHISDDDMEFLNYDDDFGSHE